MTTNIFSFSELGTTERIAFVIAVAVVSHLAVRAIRYLAHRLSSIEALSRWVKLRTLAGLITSVLIFTLYFAAIGFALNEFGVSLTAYLASASILGLAIGFGSQGLVQDVVTGLTVIFSDLFQVGDLVEISGQTGTVQNIGMRFTVLLNPLGARISIPNRSLASVIIYPRGYLRYFADITLAQDRESAAKMLDKIKLVTESFVQQFPAILRDKPIIEPTVKTATGRTFVRVQFRIWPGRSQPIENAYRQEILKTMKALDTKYEDWMISLNSEVNETPAVIRPRRQTVSSNKDSSPEDLANDMK